VTSTLYETTTVNATVPTTLYAANATTTGATVDLGQRALGFTSALVVAFAGDITDGTYVVTLEHSDDKVTWVGVPASRMQGSFASFILTSDATVQKVGYIVGKRYLRAKLTASGTTSGGTLGVMVVLGGSTHPVDNG